jgi:hypothetical protein
MSPSSDEEDDYLSFPLPTAPLTKSRLAPETLTQKTKRLTREREAKAHPRSKAELAADAKRKREEALARNILDEERNGDGDEGGGVGKSKGAAMMAKLGYKPGTALGKATNRAEQNDTRLLVPIGISEREGRGGIGADSERKRKIREEFAEREEGVKKSKVEVEDYRERQSREREEARMEGLLKGAMSVCERLDEEDEAEEGRDVAGETVRVQHKQSKRLRDIPVQYRALIKSRLTASRERLMRHDLQFSLSSRTDYLDPEEEREDRTALGKKETEEEDGELDLEDEELDEFEALGVGERLESVLMYLREKWWYCFWCKYRYAEEGMEGCPGAKEEDHD